MRGTIAARALAALIAAIPFAAAADNHVSERATAVVTGRDGTGHGTATLEATPSGAVRVALCLTALPAGERAVHIHETGDCSADGLTSAGGHVALDATHGVLTETGPHPGDLPNAHAAESGDLDVEHFNTRLDLAEHAFDHERAALIIHAGADDYESLPAGAAGDRIACGVLQAGS